MTFGVFLHAVFGAVLYVEVSEWQEASITKMTANHSLRRDGISGTE